MGIVATGTERRVGVADVFGVCPATVYKWAATSVLPHARVTNAVHARVTSR